MRGDCVDGHGGYTREVREETVAVPGDTGSGKGSKEVN